MPGGADVLQFADAANPIEFQRVVACRWIAEQRIHRHVVWESPYRRTIPVRGGVESSRGREPCGGRLVARNDVRVARNVLAEMAAERTEIDVVAAARATPDHHVDRTALVELLDALRV